MSEGDERKPGLDDAIPASGAPTPEDEGRVFPPAVGVGVPLVAHAVFEDAPAPANDGARVPVTAVRAYLARRDVRVDLVARALDRVPRTHADDLVQDTYEAALRAKARPATEEGLPAWVRGVMDVCNKNRWRKVARRAKYEGTIEEFQEFVSPSPSSEPPSVDLTRWLERATEHNPRDTETLLWLKEKAREKLTNTDLATRYGSTEEGIRKRINRFVATYKVRRRRYLLKMGLLTVLMLLAILALAYAVRYAMAKPHAIVPDRALPVPTAPAPTTTSDVFEPAAPTTARPTEDGTGKKK